ncbi:NAD(P)H-dependent oxidoreductase [Aliiglaciecola sp. CAU 1673]|uniref:NADPH-dependent FMN reductase n=1 Tax=Aliiglaciecola sp. CAU 1673 TaxID=3032595 RepID=UPI0023DC2E88|nr:NAD(P)H-dependent oxidoreductase [Aliiglaciecola sp. CAU 1673]MDF2177981.1 NAD(P)H-dependent oxidoreductase [Aliiglaciecola sp. CAU 1673]
MIKVLAFSGSARQGSFNQKLVAIAAEGARQAGAEVTLISLGDFPMPIYNQDLEKQQGLPEKALAFKQLLQSHDGLLIASPEYNSAFSPLLKNAIDWASRTHEQGEPGLSAYQGKVAGIMAASPGALGGLRGLVFLRMLLENIGVMVLPGQRAIGQAAQAFNEKDDLKDEAQRQAVMAIGSKLVDTLTKLRGR